MSAATNPASLRVLVAALSLAAALGVAVAAEAGPAPQPGADAGLEDAGEGGISQPPSLAIGTPQNGALLYGVKLPAEGEDFFTWDFPLARSPNRPWRRWTADGTLSILLRVLHRFRLAHPLAPRIGIADLSRPQGGSFGRRFGGLGHASHQNGLDADLLYPRRDGRERRAATPEQINRALSQDLVRRFVRAGAEYVFVGPRTGLTGPRPTVQALANHDDHMHVRFPRRLGAPASP